MSQQEFESQGQQRDEEIYQPQYPYTWSDQAQREGMPRDEPPGYYGAAPEQSGYQNNAPGQGQVPWWARPQPQKNGPVAFAAIIAFLILLVLVTGALGIVGVVLGSLAHIVGVILGAVFALLIFVFLLVFLVLSVVARTIGRAFGPPWMYDRRGQRRYWHNYRRMARRAARRSWRNW